MESKKGSLSIEECLIMAERFLALCDVFPHGQGTMCQTCSMQMN